MRGFFWTALSVIAATAAYADDAALQALLQKAHRERLADQPEWHRLLHFRRDLFGRYRSEIDRSEFFLSKRGRFDPAAELQATVRAFFDPPTVSTDTQTAQCTFPARYAWLKARLDWGEAIQDTACPRFEKWRGEMDAQSVVLVFASYYLNNPASMYGHTFFRMNGKQRAGRNPLLDYAVNFAAYPDNNNPILYIVEGLGGGFPGRFSTLPYYMKVQEYSNLDSRDLWEYSLQLDTATIDRMLMHLWEMGQASMPYYFLNRNCSYQLLPILEAADPSLNLSRRYGFKAIPADTLRTIIHQPGMLKDIRLRPSHANKMLAAREQLSEEEIRQVERLARRADPEAMKALSLFAPERQARILESAHDLFRFRVGFAREQTAHVLEQEQTLLVARNALSVPVSTQTVAMDLAMSPDKGHPTGRIGLSYGFSNRSQFEEISMRAALHDQDDATPGYVPGSQLEMLHLKLRFDNRRSVPYIQDFTLIDILSLSAWDRWVRKPSWKVHTGLSVAEDIEHRPEHSLYYGLQTGPGFSAATHILKREQWYTLALWDTGLGQVFREDYRLGFGTESGVIFKLLPMWHVHFAGSYWRYPLGEVGSSVRLRLIQAIPLGKSMQARATVQRQNQYKEVVLSVLRYF